MKKLWTSKIVTLSYKMDKWGFLDLVNPTLTYILVGSVLICEEHMEASHILSKLDHSSFYIQLSARENSCKKGKKN